MFFFSNLRSSTKKIMIATVYVSLIVQIITGLVQTHGLTFNFDSDDIILRDVLILETIVQFIEASFYIYVVYAISSMDMELVTPHRYFDWVITTPVMLVSTIMYMEYTKQSENKSDQEESIDGISFIKNNKENIGKIIIYNFLMLLFGYLGETNVISKYISNFIGFIFFGLSFHVIYSKYAYTVNTTEINKILFKPSKIKMFHMDYQYLYSYMISDLKDLKRSYLGIILNSNWGQSFQAFFKRA